MTTNEALRLALEALERCVATCFDQYAHEEVMSRPEHFVNQTITSIKAALEAKDEPSMKVEGPHHVVCQCDKCKAQPQQDNQQEQDCVGWFGFDTGLRLWFETDKGEDNAIPLYKDPPQRTWVGLTDEEIKEIVGPYGDTPIKGYTRKLFDQIEAKLKEKNTSEHDSLRDSKLKENT